MLAAPVMDLQTMVSTEIEKNPVLEVERGNELADLPSEEEESKIENDQDWVDQLIRLDESTVYVSKGTPFVSPEEEKRRNHYLESIAVETSFQEDLFEQLRFMNLDEQTMQCCELVISGLDDDAYLTSHPADLAMISGESLEIIDKAVQVVQSCDPPGVAARNLKERLLIQLKSNGRETSFTYKVVSECLDDLANNRMSIVAKKFKVSMEELRDVVEEIRDLNPHLSYHQTVSPGEYVSEEVQIVDIQGELDVKMNSGNVPNLRISAFYKQLLSDPSTPQETREYIREKIRAAAFLINSLNQRQSTLERIVRAIVEAQNEFFRQGVERMKPLTMAQIAREVGIHETTVSRGVAGKYLRCRHGLMPLRNFFTTGYEDEKGNSVSNMVVKNAIRKLIDEEDSSSPLSDSQIGELLTKKGLKVARRTVAKYRESMGILPSNLRRKYW